ncbi:MAG: DUF3299 domain-containing protein [Burkholderiaceae bacterium]
MTRLLLIGTILAAAAAVALAQNNSAAPAKTGNTAAKPSSSAAKPTYREIKWDDLVPADWDPFKEMKDMNLAGLSDADPRAAAALKRMREYWDNAPVNPKLEDQAVRIPGYVVPLDDSTTGLKEFLLVPYFGACIHTPPPPANQIVHVVPRVAAKGFRSMDTVWVSGTLKAAKSDTAMGASGYRLDAVVVEPYVDKPK